MRSQIAKAVTDLYDSSRIKPPQQFNIIDVIV